MTQEIAIKVPDIGGATQVDVIEVLVKEGDVIKKETSLVTLETDKASMEIPSPIAGVITKIITKVGDKVSEGDTLFMASVDSAEKTPKEEPQPASKAEETKETQSITEASSKPSIEEKPVSTSKEASAPISMEKTESEVFYAGPAVRRMARELGVDLHTVCGSGRKDRITKEDVQAYVKKQLAEGAGSSAWNMPVAPKIDFSQFGAIEVKPLNKIKKLTGVNVHRSWVSIPHVTQFDESDITDLEAFRQSELKNAEDKGSKLTLLAFVCKVVTKALKEYPQFNASLDTTGENLVYKQYCNLGIAVETPNGLVVPVIKEADTLSVYEIAKEMARLSAKARDKGLMPADMSGGCFTISSLGGIGGTGFTPIVNSPEVAILGISRSTIKPIYIQEQFIPRLLLPLSLSYDHRVIDGAEAARFTRYIAECLGDIRKVLL